VPLDVTELTEKVPCVDDQAAARVGCCRVLRLVVCVRRLAKVLGRMNVHVWAASDVLVGAMISVYA
jgi:hypothetical protein